MGSLILSPKYMKKILTLELVRKRSEHHEDELFKMQELSLHQEKLVSIGRLGRWCPNLKILYLQANQISKIENFSRMRSLENLNLALNNITLIENLQTLESIEKLDLTGNFITRLSESIKNISKNRFLKDLYLTGNPCTNIQNYRVYVIRNLPKLRFLDGMEITLSERSEAQNLSNTSLQKIISSEQDLIKEDLCRRENYLANPSENFYHCSESKAQFDLENDLLEQEKEEKKNQDSDENLKRNRKTNLYSKNGRMLNVNEMKLEFDVKYDNEYFLLKLYTPKYLNYDQIKITIESKLIRILIINQIFQIILLEEISIGSKTKTNRSNFTGILEICAPLKDKKASYDRTHSKSPNYNRVLN